MGWDIVMMRREAIKVILSEHGLVERQSYLGFRMLTWPLVE